MHNRIRLKSFLQLHILILIYSLAAVFSKKAGQSEFMSIWFVIYYGAVLAIMAVYAIAWQQIIKSFPIVTAYANKAVTIVWALLWGILFFAEEITVYKILGCGIVISGVICVVTADE